MRARRSLVALIALALVVGLALHGLGLLGTPAGQASLGAPRGFAPAAQRALVVSVPRLTWEDLEGLLTGECANSDEPACIWAEELANVGATNSLRAIGPTTSLAEGYVTLGAGNRATIPMEAPRGATQEVDGSLVSLTVDGAVADADDKLYGAEPGALGTALHAAGRETAVIANGPDAVLALMDDDGRVDGGALGVADGMEAASLAVAALASRDVVLVEIPELDAIDAARPDDVDRRRAVQDAVFAAYSAVVNAPPRTLLVVLTPAPIRDRGQLGVFTLQGATTSPDSLVQSRTPGSVFQSPTTRRAGYVTLTDMAPTVLTRLGIDVPSSMSGTPAVATSRTAAVGDMADIDRLSRYRDGIVGPVSVAYVVLQVLAAGIAIVAIRRSRRAARAAIVLSCGVLLVPPLAFLSGSLPYDRVTSAGYVMALFALALGLGGAVVAVAGRRRWPVWAPALLLVAGGLVVQWVDITTGGRLQINTPFGYSPIVAGRFQGYGNLSFAMASSAAVVVACAAPLMWPGLDRVRAAIWAGTVGGVMVVCDGVPAFGADVGGVLALIPGFVVLVSIVLGKRVGVLRLLLAGLSAVVVLVAVAAFDLSRPESQRTHLGRFAARLLDGEAGIILRRKINANISILTSSVWTWLVPVIVVFFVVIANRSHGVIRHLRDEVPGVSAFLGSSLVLAVVGFAVNDSGVAIPAAMAGVVLPWVTVLALALPASGRVAADAAVPYGGASADGAVAAEGAGGLDGGRTT